MTKGQRPSNQLQSPSEIESTLARYIALFELAPIACAALAPDGTVRELNHAGARLLGALRSGVVAAPFEAFVAAGDRGAFHALLCHAVDSEARPSCELELAPSGRSVKVRLTATAIAREERTLLLAIEDLTEQLAREEALREADRRKDELLAMVSHELRNPLGPIRSSLFVLENVEPASKQALDARAIIDRQVTLLTRLVDDLLDVTRIARGKVELQREGVELAGLVRRLLDDHRASFEARGIRLEARLEPGPLWLHADPTRLVQIASNVLGNAQKFTPRGGTVTVIVEARDGAAALCVRDTGVGIEPALIPGLFEPFVQAPTTERGRGGLGLGLAMVKGLVELHGGTVRLSSEGAWRGTEVVVLLPLAGAPARPTRAAPGAITPSRRVLVIEDNVDAAATLGHALRLMGHDVRVTHLGAIGIDVARTFQPAVVICDLALPKMDGHAVAAAFRADAALREVELIALSGYARDEDRRRAAEAGFDHHLAKPPDLQQLRRLIADASRAGAPRTAARGSLAARRSAGAGRLPRRGSAAG